MKRLKKEIGDVKGYKNKKNLIHKYITVMYHWCEKKNLLMNKIKESFEKDGKK